MTKEQLFKNIQAASEDEEIYAIRNKHLAQNKFSKTRRIIDVVYFGSKTVLVIEEGDEKIK